MLLRLALYFALALAFQCETAIVTPRADSAAWLFMAQRQQSGEMPGRDLWDNKLPPIYLVGRAAVATGHPQIFLWLLEAALTAAGAVAIARVVDQSKANLKQSTRPGTIAGAILCVALGAVSYHAGGYMTETYAMPLAAIAAWCTLHTLEPRRSYFFSVLSGALWTLAVSFRLPLGLAAVGVAGFSIIPSVDHSRRLFRVGCHTIGIAAGLLVVFAHPIIAGYLPACIDAALLWPLGIGHVRTPGPLAPGTADRLGDWAQDMFKLGWLHAAAVAGLVMGWRGGGRTSQVGAIWYLAALLSAAWGWASYAHYQYVALAPACLAIGLLIIELRPSPGRFMARALIAVTVAIVGFQVVRETAGNRFAQEDADKRAAYEYARSQPLRGDAVFIWAWGRNADILYKLNRPTGVRHFMAHAYLDMDVTLFDEFVTEFIHAPPAWILEDTRRKKPSLSGTADSLIESRVPSLRTLREFVATGYTRVAAFGSWSIHRLNRQAADVPATQSTRP